MVGNKNSGKGKTPVELETTIITELAKGKSKRKVALEIGRSRDLVARVEKENTLKIRNIQDELSKGCDEIALNIQKSIKKKDYQKARLGEKSRAFKDIVTSRALLRGEPTEIVKSHIPEDKQGLIEFILKGTVKGESEGIKRAEAVHRDVVEGEGIVKGEEVPPPPESSVPE